MKHLILTTLPRWRASIGALLAVLSLSTVPMPVHATEEPSYQVVREFSGIEVREYAAYTVAEVVVAGPAGEAGGQAFPVLAGYIFGKNKGERKFDMTAPVTQTAAPVKMEMTAPVTQSVQAGGFLVQFVLPKGVTVANAPEPLDARIQLREVAPHQVAVVRYSGFWSEANDNEHLLKLQSVLKAANLVWTGDPVFSKYDPPFKPWFLRRNEVWLRLASP
ncbi:MAG: heme-binding protein [Hydrogenophaga sp.]|uniref:SOUL family heme-binding protein n=2 Tax=Hydrogenophaga sp. TaxID=1904254 RepID=UPI0027322CB8|nr:heme-binding protein [Hydrogenophaga sp.]MDP3627356.1 heme-binding protein [Hydrogenophaga sp.]